MIDQINHLVKDRFKVIQVNTIFQLLQISIIFTSIIFSFSALTSGYESTYKYMLLLLIFLAFLMSYLGLYYVKKNIVNTSKQLKWLFIIVLVYTVLCAITSPDKYMTTNGIAVIVFTVIVFMTFSEKLLIIQGIVTVLFLGGYSLHGVGKVIVPSSGYVILNVGMYALMFVALYKGIKIFEQFRSIYNEQILILNNQNDELNALNEEYYATEEILRYNMDHDSLTGLLNWRGFITQLEYLLNSENKGAFSLVYFDIDDFMHINNAFGYHTGDQVLKRLAKKLIEKEDIIENLSRGEGDSFLFTFKKEHEIGQVMSTLNDALKNISIEESGMKLKASIGIVDVNPSSSPADLIRDAEITMYRVKKDGKGNYAFHHSIYGKHMDEQFKIFSELDDAIEHNEFYLLYQPKVDIKNKQVIGFEALVRWESSRLGPVFPDQFIQVAEYTGQIIELGNYIMKQAMCFAKKSAAIDKNIRISINISSKQLLDSQFVSKVVDLVKETGVDVKNIAFEVTETAYVENIVLVNDVLKQINDLGIVIYLDDFGTGYSSLSYLNQLPIQVLKIDKAFIDQIHIEEPTTNLTRTILLMAKSLNMECIAEGVEKTDQLEVLDAFGCNYIQGYLFDKPLSEGEALKKVLHIYE